MKQQGPDNGDNAFRIKRAIVGSLALMCFVLAMAIFIIAPESRGVVLASAIRIGIVLFAIWLALPQLRGILDKLPSLIPAAAVLLVILCAARPSLFRIIGTLIAVGGGLIAVSKWIQSVTKK